MRRLCLLAFVLLPLLSSCLKSTQAEWDGRIQPDFDSQTVYDNATVERGKPLVFKSPQEAPNQAGAALMFPMEVRQDVTHPERIGRELGRTLARTWTKEKVFPDMLYAGEITWPGLPNAFRIARDRGADFVIRPILNHFLLGGSRGATSLSFSVLIYSRASGEAVWSMGHAGRMDSPPDRDYIFYTRKVRMPTAPEYVVLTVLSEELAVPVRKWLHSKQSQSKSSQREDPATKAEPDNRAEQ